jgi:hypothetical protein
MASAPSLKQAHVVIPLVCPACFTSRTIHILARTGFAQVEYQPVTCAKCGESFEVMVPDKIIGGPYLREPNIIEGYIKTLRDLKAGDIAENSWFTVNQENAASCTSKEKAQAECYILETLRVDMPSANGGRFKIEERQPMILWSFAKGLLPMRCPKS